MDTAVYMDYIGIFQTPYYMDDGLHFADIGKELITQTFIITGTFYQASDIHDFNGIGDCFLRDGRCLPTHPIWYPVL